MAKSAPSTEQLLAAFDPHAVAIAKRQYFQPGDETLEDMFRRVARWVATPDREEAEDYAERYFQLMAGKRFCPGGRVLAGAATSHGNVLNCFVQDGRPAEPGTDDWVIGLAKKLALVTKVGGGNGLCLDPIRPKRPFAGPAGELYVTVRPEHPDHDKVRDGTFMDLVHGSYTTKGYRTLRFVRHDELPAGLEPRHVGDSVDAIWDAAGGTAKELLAGRDVLLDLSELRPEGTPVNGSGGTSSGPSSFAVEVFDNFATWARLGGAEHAGPVATLRYVFAPTLRVIRQGGCLHPDTLVHTSRGTLRLGEIVDPHQYGWQDHHLKVATDEGWRDSPRGYNNGNAPTLRVTLGNGQTVQGTARHRLKVQRADGARDWVRLEDLHEGDQVIQTLDQHTGAPVLLRPVEVPPHDAREIELPEILGERLAFFLGCLWGDGFVHEGRVGLSVAQGSPMMEEAPRLFRELFGLPVREERNEHDASAYFVARSSQLVSWLVANDLDKGKARSLEVPKPVRAAPRPVLGAFLRGLFEADGTLVHGHPTLSTASSRLAQDVAALLVGLGIPCTQRALPPRDDRHSRHPIYHVRVVTPKGLERFLERVGTIQGSRLEAAHVQRPEESRSSSWPLPHAPALLAESRAALPAGAKGRASPHASTRKTLSRPIRGARTLTAAGYERLPADAELGKRLAPFEHDEHLVPVAKVEAGGRSLTLDLSVEGNATYLAGGIVSHNTRRGAGMATMTIDHPDVHDFITAKDLEREQAEGDISTFNISVLASDAFIQGARAKGGDGVLKDIAEHAWRTGEPGLIFIDRINEHNPMLEAYGEIKSTNPCVTAETWVMTSAGARQVRDLVGRQFCALVDGKSYALESDGFWSTGVKPVVRLRTRRGFELRLTANHRLNRVDRRTRNVQRTSWTPVSELRSGDCIALQNQRGSAPWSGAGSYDEGWLLGSLVGDGTYQTDKSLSMACLDFWGEGRRARAQRARDAIVDASHVLDRLWVSQETREPIRLTSSGLAKLAERYGIEPGNKTVTDDVERGGFEFYRGFLRGLFDADGSVQGGQDKGVSVRLAQSDFGMLQRVQRMLARLGVISTIYADRRPAGMHRLPDGRGGLREYPMRARHELVVSQDNLGEFARVVGFEDEAKSQRLDASLGRDRRAVYAERFADEIVEIVPDGEEEVFDVTVERVHAFDANGFAAHNCGEIPLYPGEPCDLGAMNLAAYVSTTLTGLDGFDFASFREDVAACTRFLDNVLEVNRFALEDNREMSMKLRRLGLGVMGLADALIKMGFAYHSDEGREAVRVMIDALREAATEASERLAEERGPFPGAEDAQLERPRRNVAVLTVAPTGTTSMLMGVSSGVEPVFAPFIHRKIGDSYAALIHPLFRELLDRHAPAPDFAGDDGWDWDKVVEAVQENHGSVQGLDFIPDDVKAVLICAHDIRPEDHVKMQGVVQRSFDGGGARVANSISKTINLPNRASAQDVFDAYALAVDEQCKGITVYRDGSRQFQVLSTKVTKPVAKREGAPERDGPDEQRSSGATPPVARANVGSSRGEDTGEAPAGADRLPGEPLFDRPGRLEGFTDAVKLMLPSGEQRGFYVTVNKQDGLPTEVFILSGKAGDEANADSEALGRMVSIALQYGVPAEAVVKTLRGINGGMYGSYQGRLVASKADLIAVALETAGVQNGLDQGKGCPDCGAPLRFEEGCSKCESCGFSKCG